MGFLFTLIMLLGSDVLLLVYLLSSQFFKPTTFTGDVDILNIILFVLMIAFGLGLFVSIVVYLVEKFVRCGKKEYPAPGRSIKYGILTALVAAILVFLHIFHFLNFFAGLALFALLVIGIMIIR